MTQEPVTVASLMDQLPGVLIARGSQALPTNPVDGVHISELIDPTPFLHGGELLLTTGMALPLTGAGARAYVSRLCRRGVVALGLGLGPFHVDVPGVLERACARQSLPLLIIPAEARFQDVTRTYWALLGQAHERILSAALSSHRRLVAAGTSADPVPAVLEVVGRAIDGEVLLTDPHGRVVDSWPTPVPTIPELTAAMHRVRSLGARSAATFPLGERLGSLNPVVAGDAVEGYLCTVSRTPLEATNRGLLLAALAMLALDAHHRRRAASGDRLLRTVVASLVDRGHLSAVRSLVSTLPVESPPPKVRVAAVRHGAGQGRLALDALTESLPGHGWWGMATDRTAWIMVHPGLVSLDQAQLREVVTSLGADAVATVGPLVDLAGVHAMRTGLEAKTLGLPGGTVSAGTGEGVMPFVTDDWARGVLAPIHESGQLIEAVAALLRNRGSWEPAARDLGIHRNSLRARIRMAERLLEGDLADPDLAARVWIALRTTGVEREEGEPPCH